MNFSLQVLFVCTANVVEMIPNPLLDRMEVVSIAGYITDEKMHIARDYLEKTTREACGIKPEQVFCMCACTWIFASCSFPFNCLKLGFTLTFTKCFFDGMIEYALANEPLGIFLYCSFLIWLLFATVKHVCDLFFRSAIPANFTY